jgi:glycosyltransferase involved in cell wall biosynthesis
MIPVYNCTRFIPDALRSVLSQDLGEDQMQIEVVDDGSTDADVEALVMSLGEGRVKYYKQPQNVGSLRNFETCINRANGHLVHILHGDDRVKDGFYRKFTTLFEEFPEAGAAFCGYSTIDDKGSIIKNYPLVQSHKGWLDQAYLKMAAGLPIQFATTIVKREVYENIGSFCRVIAGEDWEMWTRIAKSYRVAFIPEILAEYRRYFGTISWPFKEDGKYAKCLAETTFYIESQLPKEQRHVMKKTRKRRAISTINAATDIWDQSQDWNSVNEMLKVSLRLTNNSYVVYKKILKLYYKIFKNSFLPFSKKLIEQENMNPTSG